MPSGNPQYFRERPRNVPALPPPDPPASGASLFREKAQYNCRCCSPAGSAYGNHQAGPLARPESQVNSAERLRPAGGAGVGFDRRDLPPARRQHQGARRAAALLPGRDRDHSLITPKAALCGSVTTAKRPAGLSIAGARTEPPNSCALATAASVSATAK